MCCFAVFLLSFFLQQVQVPVPPNIQTPESLASYIIWILLSAIVILFLFMIQGGKTFWSWQKEQFEYLKGEIEDLQSEVKKEREDRTKENRELLDKVLSKFETEKINRKDILP